METLATVLATLDELETQIVDMELHTNLLAAQMQPPCTDDQVALEVANMALASLWSQRRLLLATIEEPRPMWITPRTAV